MTALPMTTLADPAAAALAFQARLVAHIATTRRDARSLAVASDPSNSPPFPHPCASGDARHVRDALAFRTRLRDATRGRA